MERRPLRGAVAVTNPRQVWFITGAHAVNEFYSVALPPILHLLVADFDLTLGQAGALLTVFYGRNRPNASGVDPDGDGRTLGTSFTFGADGSWSRERRPLSRMEPPDGRRPHAGEDAGLPTRHPE